MRNSFLSLLLGLLVMGGLLAAQSTQAPSSPPAPADRADDSPAVTFQVQIDYVRLTPS